VIDSLSQLVVANLNKRHKKAQGKAVDALKLLVNVISEENNDDLMNEGWKFLLNNLMED
jgi:hypothetical protein